MSLIWRCFLDENLKKPQSGNRGDYEKFTPLEKNNGSEQSGWYTPKEEFPTAIGEGMMIIYVALFVSI